MTLFYTASSKVSLDARKSIFTDLGFIILKKKGFEKSPFTSSWFGRNNLGSYSYELCRIVKNSKLEFISVLISRQDDWIKIFINAFSIHPIIENIEQLAGLDGMQYHLPPNLNTTMRIRIDANNKFPLFSMLKSRYNIGLYFSKSGFDRNVHRLKNTVLNDLYNIDYFFDIWYRENNLATVNWDGFRIKL